MKNIYKRHRFPPSVIQHAVWLYYRFNLSVRDVEDFLAERNICVSYKATRRWINKFDPKFARRLQRYRSSDCALTERPEQLVLVPFARNRHRNKHKRKRCLCGPPASLFVIQLYRPDPISPAASFSGTSPNATARVTLRLQDRRGGRSHSAAAVRVGAATASLRLRLASRTSGGHTFASLWMTWQSRQ
jgi:hypothetical protein